MRASKVSQAVSTAFSIRLFIVTALIFIVTFAAQAKTVTLDNLMPTIRLCPVSCISVSGHKLRNGNTVEVLEVRNGWARISPWLDAEKLKRSFGDRVPEKPAYWVALSRTSGLGTVGKQPETRNTEKKETTKRAAKRQKRRVTLPATRPGTKFARLEPVENSLMTRAFAEEQKSAANTADKAIAEAASAGSEDAFEPVRVSLAEDTSPRILTSGKMAEWIAANRGAVIEDLQDDAVAKQPSTVSSGEALETKIATLKGSVEAPDRIGEVPDVMITELLDKRLNILPGMNANIPEETVIALRHYALGLLESGTCKGIAGGGAGEKADTIYLVCTDDLTKTLEFPLGSSG